MENVHYTNYLKYTSSKGTLADCPVAPKAKYSRLLTDSVSGNEPRGRRKGAILHSTFVCCLITESFPPIVFFMLLKQSRNFFHRCKYWLIFKTKCFFNKNSNKKKKIEERQFVGKMSSSMQKMRIGSNILKL